MNDGHQWLGYAPTRVHIHDGPPCAEDHDPLHHGREEEEGEGDADNGVHDTEGFTSI